MKIDELIKELEQVKDEHGNLETNVRKSTLHRQIGGDKLFINTKKDFVKTSKSNLENASKNNIEFL